MKKFLLFVIPLMVCCRLASAQVGHVDSLRKAYQKNKQDSTLALLLVEKSGTDYLTTNTDSGMICARQALALSRKIHFKKGEVRSLAAIATFLNISGDLPGSLKVTFEALPEAISINETRVIASCYNTRGLTYSILKDHKKSLDNYYMGKKVVEKSHINDLLLVELNNISREYLDFNKLDSALYFTQKAYDLGLKVKMTKNIGYLIRNFGIIQFKKKNYSEAINYYYKSIKAIPGNKNHYLLSEDHRRIAEAYQAMHQPDSCINHAKVAFEQAKLDRNPDQVQRATKLLTEVYLSKNDFKEAFNYQQIMIKAQDSLFSQQKTLQVQNLAYNEEQRKQQIEAAAIAYKNKVRFYTLIAVAAVFVLLASILLFANSKRRRANKLLHQRNEQIQTQHKALEKTLSELKTRQTQLIQSEKMASLGELTAGIAHEIQNPLNFVNNFSEVNAELLDEMQQEIDKGDFEEVKAIAASIKENEQKITQHGKRADGIVKGMLQHSRTNTGEKQLVDMNELTDEYLRLAYHGLRAKDKLFNAEMSTHYEPGLPKISVVQQNIGRVMLNLFSNAFYAVNLKSKTVGSGYKPEIMVTTLSENGKVTIKIKDNGNGIPEDIKDKIMQPFFTTKPAGEGTGLGLSLTYDMIVKEHGGSIDINSIEGEGAEFIITLPIS
ncbi:MAG TPA: ATP-binding protein [Mucilaginibacter sp.]